MFMFALYPTSTSLRAPRSSNARRRWSRPRARWAFRRQAFRRVELPLARPAIAGGVALALMETLADYGTVAYFAVDTFTTGIYRAWFSLGDRTAAAQLATALLVFVIGAVALERASRGARAHHGGARGRQSARSRRPAHRRAGWAAAAICALPLLVGFVAAAAAAAAPRATASPTWRSPRAFRLAWNSVRVAALAAVLAVVLATLVAYAVRLAPGCVARRQPRADAGLRGAGHRARGRRAAAAGRADRWLIETLRAHRRQPGLLLTGRCCADLRLPGALLRGGLERRRAGLRAHHAGDGRRRAQPRRRHWGTLMRVHAPLLGRSGAAALLLVFVDVMKELPATLVLRPFNFDTLATQTYLLAKDERLAEASLPALAIVAVGLVPILALARMARRGRAHRRHAVLPVPDPAYFQPVRSTMFCASGVFRPRIAIGSESILNLPRASSAGFSTAHRSPPATRCCHRRSRAGPRRSRGIRGTSRHSRGAGHS